MMEKPKGKVTIKNEGFVTVEAPSPEGIPTFLNNNVVPGPVDKKKQVGKKKQVTITFRENRAFELHIGQEVLRFEGMESKQIDKDLLEHPAFKQARKYFTIKGI